MIPELNQQNAIFKEFSKTCFRSVSSIQYNIGDLLQILLLLLREFKQISQLLFPLKSSENHKFFSWFQGE